MAKKLVEKLLQKQLTEKQIEDDTLTEKLQLIFAAAKDATANFVDKDKWEAHLIDQDFFCQQSLYLNLIR